MDRQSKTQPRTRSSSRRLFDLPNSRTLTGGISGIQAIVLKMKDIMSPASRRETTPSGNSCGGTVAGARRDCPKSRIPVPLGVGSSRIQSYPTEKYTLIVCWDVLLNRQAGNSERCRYGCC